MVKVTDVSYNEFIENKTDLQEYISQYISFYEYAVNKIDLDEFIRQTVTAEGS